MKLLGNTKHKTTEDKNGENVSHLKIAGVVLVRCNVFNKNYQQDLKALYVFVPNKLFRRFTQKNCIFQNF